jgi:hypothetical protein
MQSHELLREVIKDSSAKQIAADLNLSLSMIYKWSEPPENIAGSGLANPLDRMEQLIKSTNDARLPQWICERAGGFFIHNPKAHSPHPFQVIPATNQIVQEFADMLGVIAAAAGDSHITKAEAKDIRRRWEDLKRVTEGFVHCCESGSFAPVKQPAAAGPPERTPSSAPPAARA